LIFGGIINDKLNNEIIKYNLKENSYEILKIKNNLKPKERIKFSMNKINDKFFIIFGGKENEHSYLNDLWIFDIENLIWNDLTKFQKNPPNSIIVNQTFNEIYLNEDLNFLILSGIYLN
jgi:hypothetical protein